MRKRGEGRVSRQCLLCGRTFRVFKANLTRRGNGNFCSKKCLFAAWHLFSEALALERMGPILKELAAIAREKEQKKAA